MIAPRETEPPSRTVMNVTIHRLHIATIRVSGNVPGRVVPTPARDDSLVPEPGRDDALGSLQRTVEQLQREMARLARPGAERSSPPASSSPQPGPSRARSPFHSRPLLTPLFKKGKRLVNQNHSRVETPPEGRSRTAAPAIELAEEYSVQVDSSAYDRAFISIEAPGLCKRRVTYATICQNSSALNTALLELSP